MQAKQLYFFVVCIAITTLMTHASVAMEKGADDSSNFEILEMAFDNLMKDIKDDLKHGIKVSDATYKRCLALDLTIKRCLRDGTSSCWDREYVILKEEFIDKIRPERSQIWYDGPSPD